MVLNAPVVATAPDAAASVRDVCGVGGAVPLLVYSGLAAKKRGIDIMVEALPRLAAAHVALVVNKPAGAYVRQLMSRAAELGVSERLHVLPYVPHDQVAAFLATADVGVIPIHHHVNHEIALITKYFEYAHARLPIVVSDVRTMAQATRSLGLGEVFRAADVDDFVRAISTVLADPDRYRSAYAKPGLLDSWTWEAQAKLLDDVYGRLLPTVAAQHAIDQVGGRALDPVINELRVAQRVGPVQRPGDEDDRAL